MSEHSPAGCSPVSEEKRGASVQPENDGSTGGDSNMSKRQRKKLLKQQKWEEERDMRKQRRKERKQQRQQQRQSNREQERGHGPRKRLRRDVTPSSLRLVVDCSFDDLMLIKTTCLLILMLFQDIRKLYKQIQRCYAENRRASRPVQFYLTSLGGQLKQNMDEKDKGWINWKVPASNLHLLHQRGGRGGPTSEFDLVFVFLPKLFSSFTVKHTYCPPGSLAVSNLWLGFLYRSFPRPFLLCPAVFEIILAYLEKGSWQEAFFTVLPQRKGAVAVHQVGTAQERGEEGSSSDSDPDTEPAGKGD
ncbi:tRNA methyltransferase 10A [Nothobranchius furzeri]|uniref:tRNA (guanine(9)-N(1))-methyltransferase n=1 Tax=Nothobranchius furzeri TaxID=105023 RepID=A0A9D2XS94_NOTFU|nr:tRNA methyltransferase 10A [Nothobranchius furzeri]